MIFITSMCSVLRSEGQSYIISEDITYSYKSPQSSMYTIHRKVYVGDEYGKSFGYIYEMEDEYRKIITMKCAIFDTNNKKLRKLRKKDIKIVTASPGFILYSGSKYHIIDIKHQVLPYIIDYEVKIKLTSHFFWPGWYPQSSISCEQASYKLIIPDHINFKHKIIGDIPAPIVSNDSYTWTLTNIPAYPDEIMSAPEDRIQYNISFSPSEFNLDRLNGSFQSWNDFSEWYKELYQMQLDLQPNSQELGLILAQTSTEKAQILLEYIQKNMRYVAIEEGIHGWKPHKASQVLANKYGDCKDLAIYYVNQLRLYGVEAYPVLLRTRGTGVIDPNFVTNRFNHAIACVLIANDTFWVDCTGKYNTIYDVGANDEGCNALLIGDDGGQIITIPVSKAEDNQRLVRATANIDIIGNTIFTGTLSSTGNIAQYHRRIFLDESDSEKRKILTRWLSDYSPDLKIIDLKYSNFDNNHQPIKVEFMVDAGKYVKKSRSRYFINPNFYYRVNYTGENPVDRQTSVYYNYPQTSIDTVSYKFSERVIPEYLPEKVRLENLFGSYEMEMQFSDSTLLFIRKREITQRLIDISDYEEYYSYMEALEKHDKKKAVFRIDQAD